MEEHIFSDGIGRISVIGGVVRLDLVTYSATETDVKGQPRPVLTQRLTMGSEAFLRSAEKVVEAVQLMTRAQAVTPAAQPASPTPPAPPPAPAATASSPWTPPPARSPFP